jgi:hypothetical protein
VALLAGAFVAFRAGALVARLAVLAVLAVARLAGAFAAGASLAGALGAATLAGADLPGDLLAAVDPVRRAWGEAFVAGVPLLVVVGLPRRTARSVAVPSVVLGTWSEPARDATARKMPATPVVVATPAFCAKVDVRDWAEIPLR